jgi:hypothetical protein
MTMVRYNEIAPGMRAAHYVSRVDMHSRYCMTAAATALLALGLAGCTAGDDQDMPARSPVDSAGVATTADTAGAKNRNTRDDSVPADEREAAPGAVMGAEWTAADTEQERTVTGAALLRAMRTARHDGFDRIVLDFGGDDVPAYRISYIDSPVRQCGSGNEVPMAGEGWLSITVQPANAHTEQGEPTIRERERAPALPVLLELKLICDFEAVVEVVAGVAAAERYRSFVLASPNRLVIDIMHP